MTDITMANQQVKGVSEADIAYLAGALDGEGCFTIARKADVRYKAHGFSYSANVYFTNTDAAFVARVSEILDALGVGGHITTRKQPERAGNKSYYVITIGRLRSLERLLSIVMPWLTAKKGQAQLLYRFVCGRVRTLQPNGKSQTRYTDEEMGLVQQIRQLNNPNGSRMRYAPESSEAIRQAPAQAG